ncbi:hypothetical protein BOTBODRAFT_175817 [Botryobasidium botryosum FD-172 SS1]|uniref:Transmembrane protein n=1 Tax=Botryobasidium botryosum (strain FD-172 SS1) TaxID=930990 RepID=A0A067MMV0_BOTB1|nr:hypothetical protein BOTBODRAFT_175817 [Botryobasidium botryosum FD-172 SS1]
MQALASSLPISASTSIINSGGDLSISAVVQVPETLLPSAAQSAVLGRPVPQTSFLVVACKLGWDKALPSWTMVNQCSCGILIACIAIFGYQKDQSMVIIDTMALNAAVMACLASCFAMFFGLAHNQITGWLPSPVAAAAHDTQAAHPTRKHIFSLAFRINSCACLFLACLSFSVFLVRVVWCTSPHALLAFSAAMGGTTTLLLCFGLTHYYLSAEKRMGMLP